MSGARKREFNSFPKNKPARDDKYLAFVRGHRCWRCKRPPFVTAIQAHHAYTGGMSTKCSDYDTIPACFECHDTIKQRKNVPDSIKTEIKALNVEWRKQGGTFKNEDWRNDTKSDS